MKMFARIVSLLTLVSFVWLAGVEACHHHKDAQAEAHCIVCQISHQARVSVPAPPLIHSETSLGSVVPPALSQPALQVVLVSHCLSPPTL